MFLSIFPELSVIRAVLGGSMKSTATNHSACEKLPTNIQTKHRVRMSLECSCCQLKAWDENREKILLEKKSTPGKDVHKALKSIKLHISAEIKHQNCILMFTKTLCMKINYFTSIKIKIFFRDESRNLSHWKSVESCR